MSYNKIFTFVLLFVTLTGTALANTSESISVDSISMDSGSTSLVQVHIENAVEIAGMSFDLNFDPAVINIIGVGSSTEVPDSSVNPNIDNNAGTVNVVLTNTNLISSTDSVPIINILVSAVGDSAATTQLTFANMELTDTTFVPFTPSGVTDGSVEIAGATEISTPSFTSSSSSTAGDKQDSDTESVIIEEPVEEETEETAKTVVNEETTESSAPASEQESQSTPFLGVLSAFLMVVLASRFRKLY